MPANDTNPSQGQECSGIVNEESPDWEALARREMWMNLEEISTELGIAAGNVGHEINESGEPVEALRELRQKFFQMDERTREYLVDIEKIDRQDSEFELICCALNLAHVVLMSKDHEPAREVDSFERLEYVVRERNREEFDCRE